MARTPGKPMEIFLVRTIADCYRPPNVLEWVRQRLGEGKTVAMVSRDHPDTLPDGVVHEDDDWTAIVDIKPSVAVLDNIVFDDPTGIRLRRWNSNEGRYVPESRNALDAVLDELRDAGTEEVLLVSEEELSGATVWRGWLNRKGVTEYVDFKTECRYRRVWWLNEQEESRNRAYRYRENRLLKTAEPQNSRRFSAEFVTPVGEALLALVGEYASTRFDTCDPDDPGRLNQRDDMFHEIIEALSGTVDPRVILTALDELFDIVTDHIDFSRSRWDRGEIQSCGLSIAKTGKDKEGEKA